MASSPLRRIVGALASALLACLAVTGFAGAAHAEDGYQYWNYFHLENDAWEFSMDGPAEYQPKDGAVEAFRYGTSTETQGIEPRVDLAEVSFDTVCADQDAAAGEKRVAVVLDYGTDEGNGTRRSRVPSARSSTRRPAPRTSSARSRRSGSSPGSPAPSTATPPPAAASR